MGDFKKLTLKELCDVLCKNERTLIVYHVRPDADAIGSAFALKKILSLMGISAFCACSDEVPSRLSFLSEDSQGSVLIDPDMPVDHERVISVDSASPSQLGAMFDYLKKDVDLMIDHHAMGTVYADNYIDAGAAATAEIIYDIAAELVNRGELSCIPSEVYGLIYAGLSSDTGGFRFANATPKSYRIAADIIEKGVDTAYINHMLFSSKSPKQLAAEGEAARRLNLYCSKTVAVTTIPYTSKYSLGLNDEDMETVIDIPRSLAGVEVAVAVRQSTNENIFRASMRSIGDIDVSYICSKFGGGGHKRAAGCTVEASGIDDAEKKIVREIKEYLSK